MKALLIVTAFFEGVTGLGLLLVPNVVVTVLLGVQVDTPVGFIAARLAGAAILSLAIACWQARNSERGGAATGIVAGMLFYNVAAALILVYAGMRLELRSEFLWPAIVVHLVLALWCGLVVWKYFQKTV